MDKTTQKRIINLLVRIGDEGPDNYYKNLEKLINITPTFMKEEENKKYLLDNLRQYIRLNPSKSFIYACYYSILLSTYPEDSE